MNHGKVYELFIPIEPVPKGRPRFTKFGHAYNPSKTRIYEQNVSVILKSLFKEKPLEDATWVKMTFFLSRTKTNKRLLPTTKPDVDNISKAILDSANGILWSDDKLIVSLSARKLYCIKDPGTLIRFGLMNLNTNFY
jgi:Holliday junction resolvase RusA-like endonuclease